MPAAPETAVASLLALGALSLAAAVPGCSSAAPGSYYRSGQEVRLIKSIPSERPDWMNGTPSPQDGLRYFVGTSSSAATEAHAKDLALADALKKAAAFAGVTIGTKAERKTRSEYKASETADPAIAETEKVLESASAYFGRFHPEQWYIEQYGRMVKDQVAESSYQVSVLLSIPEDEIEAAIAEARREHQEARRGAKSPLGSFWSGREQDGVVLVNDGSSAEDFEIARAVLSEFLTKNGILVVQNESSAAPGHPLVGIKASYSENPDVYGNKSLTGTYLVRVFVKDKEGREIVGKTVVASLPGVGKTPRLAKQASLSSFVENKGSSLLGD